MNSQQIITHRDQICTRTGNIQGEAFESQGFEDSGLAESVSWSSTDRRKRMTLKVMALGGFRASTKFKYRQEGA